MRLSRDKRCKPESVVLCNHKKAGVDVVDLVLTQSTTRIKHKRRFMNALDFVLDTVRTNAKTILQEFASQVKTSSFGFTSTLGKMLVPLLIEQRYVSPNSPQ